MELATHNEDKTDNLIIYYQNTRSLHNQKEKNRNLKSSSEAHTFKWKPYERQWNNNWEAILCWDKDLKEVVCSLGGKD